DVVVDHTATQDLLLTNNDGRAETSVAITPPSDPSVFTVVPPGELPLAAEQSMVVRIKFRPDKLASYASSLLVTPCPHSTPRRINLTGRGVDKLLVVRPEAIDFGEVLLGADVSQPFTLTNTSKRPLAVEASAASGSPDLTATLEGAPPPRTLGPGETV